MPTVASAEQAREWFSSAALSDILDRLGHPQAVLPGSLRPLEPTSKICGRAATLLMGPVRGAPGAVYGVEMACIDALAPGEVLVITTQGNTSSSVWGELMSTSARAHGAVGVVIDGLARDAARILTMDFPVFAAGFSPRDSRGRLEGVSFGQALRIGPCVVKPGDWIFGDIDGVVVIPTGLVETVFSAALVKIQQESRIREELACGRSIRTVFSEHGVL